MLRSARDESAGQRPAFIFIHGYNNSFADAARRTAQMAFDLDLDIVPIMYNWPSRGNVWDYQRDRRQFERSVPHLVEFLDRKVLLLTGLLLIVILLYRWRIRSLKRAFQRCPV
jgi:esterase/lipase superfamily enzyme